MAALAAERDVPRKGLGTSGVLAVHAFKIKASTKIYKGALVAVDATGYALPAALSTAHRVVGVAQDTVDNTSGASGDKVITCMSGEFPFNNSLSADLITITEIWKLVYVVDDNTVAKTSATSTRSVAGLLTGFDEAGLPLVQVGATTVAGA